MTWAQIVADGRGAAAYMLDAEGWPDLWVTDARLAGTQSDTRVRHAGLTRKGLGKRERLRLSTATLDVGGFRARIVDDFASLAATVSFTKEPLATAWLTANVPDDTSTSWAVSASSVFTNNLYYHSGAETIQVTAKPDATHITVVRGQWGTVARAHMLGYADRLQYPVITDRPTILMGRRVKLYAFGPDELALGAAATGTVIFRGRVNSAPILESGGTTYSFGVDHAGKCLDQDLASGLDKGVRIRGVYYAWNAPVIVGLDEHSGADQSSSSGSHTGTMALSGFFESQDTFCAALNTALATMMTARGFTQQVVAVAESNGWHFEVRTNGTPKWVGVAVAGGALVVDGQTDQTSYRDLTTDPYAPGGVGVTTLAANAAYQVAWQDATGVYDSAFENPDDAVRVRAVPRAVYSAPIGAGLPTGDPSLYPATRLFVDRADLLNVGDDVGSFVVVTKNGGGTVGSVDLDRPLGVGSRYGYGAAFAGNGYTFTVAERYTVGTLADFVASLEAAVPTSTPGTMPNVTIADLSVSSAVVDAAIGGGGDFLRQRLYRFTKAQKLSDVFAKECLVAGLIPYVTSAGKISVRKFALLAPTDTLLSTIGARIVSKGFGEVDWGAEGYFGAVEVKSGYDSDTDKFRDGEDDLVRNVKAIERFQTTRTLVVDPKISSLYVDGASFDEVNTIAWPLLTLFGERYAVVSIDVTLKDYATLIGDVVSLTVPQLPYAGVRGISNKVALVLGDEWDYDSGKGKLVVLLSSLNLAGYAATARVSSQVDNGGNDWNLTIDRNFYFADPTKPVSDHFAIGDTVRIIQWNASVPTTVTGTVTSVTATTIRVQFAGVWVPGASTWNLMFRGHAVATTRQRTYAYVAASDRRLSTGDPARVNAP